MIVGLCAFMYWLMCHIDAFFTLFLIIHTRLRDEDGKYLLVKERKGHDGHLSRSGRGGGRGGKEGR